MKNAGKSAFPHPDNTLSSKIGLTKREYFAAMAMQGLLAHHGDGDYSRDSIASYAVAHADELLTELYK